MQKTTITVVVLSEEPIDERMDIVDVVREWEEGDFVLFSTRMESEKLSDVQMARALWEAGSDPGFFQLDHIEVNP